MADDCDACKTTGVGLFHNDDLDLALCEPCDLRRKIKEMLR